MNSLMYIPMELLYGQPEGQQIPYNNLQGTMQVVNDVLPQLDRSGAGIYPQGFNPQMIETLPQQSNTYGIGSQQEAFQYSEPQLDYANQYSPTYQAIDNGTMQAIQNQIYNQARMPMPMPSEPQMQAIPTTGQTIKNALLRGMLGSLSSTVPFAKSYLQADDQRRAITANATNKYNNDLETYYKAFKGMQGLTTGNITNLSNLENNASTMGQNIATMGAGKDLYKTMQEISRDQQRSEALRQFAQQAYGVDIVNIDDKSLKVIVENFVASGYDTKAGSVINKNKYDVTYKEGKLKLESKKTDSYISLNELKKGEVRARINLLNRTPGSKGGSSKTPKVGDLLNPQTYADDMAYYAEITENGPNPRAQQGFIKIHGINPESVMVARPNSWRSKSKQSGSNTFTQAGGYTSKSNKAMVYPKKKTNMSPEAARVMENILRKYGG